MSEIPMAPDPQDPRAEQHEPPARRSTVRRLAPAVGLVVAGLAAGALGAGVLGHASSGPTGGNAAATSTRQGGPSGGFAGGRGGGIAGELRVRGTITAVTSTSITVKQVDGTTSTYTANGTTDVQRDGAQSSLSALKAGDEVLVHVLPASGNGGAIAERILAGRSATQPGPGGPPPAAGGTGVSTATGTVA